MVMVKAHLPAAIAAVDLAAEMTVEHQPVAIVEVHPEVAQMEPVAAVSLPGRVNPGLLLSRMRVFRPLVATARDYRPAEMLPAPQSAAMSQRLRPVRTREALPSEAMGFHPLRLHPRLQRQRLKLRQRLR